MGGIERSRIPISGSTSVATSKARSTFPVLPVVAPFTSTAQTRLKWVKPGAGVFRIHYRGHSAYEPDFVVELIRRLGREVGLAGGDVMEVAPAIARSFTVPKTASLPISPPGNSSGVTTKLSVVKASRAPGS